MHLFENLNYQILFQFFLFERLKWLPRNIPSNVKILLSTLPEAKLGIFEKLHHFFPADSFIEVTDLDDETGNEILQNWLAKANRNLTKDQHELVMKGFRSSPNPLFLKVSFNSPILSFLRETRPRPNYCMVFS